MSILLRSLSLAFVVALLGCSSPPHASNDKTETDAEFIAAATRAFEDPHNACLILLDLPSGRTRVLNPSRADQRFPPASTSKILNGLIGLDTGVISNADHILKWDGTRHERDLNNRDHSLRSAVHYSVLWYFQEITRRVGAPQMQASINALNYGNRDISSGLTTFWLRGSLRISAHEQVAFLRKLHDGTLPAKARAMNIIKDCLILAQGPNWSYRGKTGTYSGPVDGIDSDLGWFVGWIEKNGQTLIFAASDSTPNTTGPDVKGKVEQTLIQLGLLPPDWQQHQRQIPLP